MSDMFWERISTSLTSGQIPLPECHTPVALLSLRPYYLPGSVIIRFSSKFWQDLESQSEDRVSMTDRTDRD